MVKQVKEFHRCSGYELGRSERTGNRLESFPGDTSISYSPFRKKNPSQSGQEAVGRRKGLTKSSEGLQIVSTEGSPPPLDLGREEPVKAGPGRGASQQQAGVMGQGGSGRKNTTSVFPTFNLLFLLPNVQMQPKALGQLPSEQNPGRMVWGVEGSGKWGIIITVLRAVLEVIPEFGRQWATGGF